MYVEVDGAQHFDREARYYNEDITRNDLKKERWAVAQGASVVRVLQEDAWKDRFGWSTQLAQAVSSARNTPGVYLSNVHEYSASWSAYAQL